MHRRYQYGGIGIIPVNHPSDEDLPLGTPVNHPSDEDLPLGTPVKRGLVTKPEEWLWSSYRHYQTGMHGTVEIESEWTACASGWQLAEWMRNRQLDSPSPVPKSEGPGAPTS